MTELYDALEDCLEAIARGASVEQALKHHPGLASELRPLLQTSLMAREAGRIRVPPDVRRKGRSDLIDRVREGRDRTARGRMIPFFPRLALTGALVAALALTSTGLVGASSTSLPGQQLYPVKRTWESVRLLFAFNPQERDLMEVGYEQERLDEISELLGKGLSAPITFSGLLSQQAGGRWTISGIPVDVGSSTQLPSAPVYDGAPIMVTGTTRPDGVVAATNIELLQPGVSLPPLEPSEHEEHGDSQGEDQGHSAAPTLPPAQAGNPTQPASSGGDVEHTTYQFSGVVQTMQGSVWTINGQPVYLDAAQVDGQVTIGSAVRFLGYYASDGRFVVTSIELQSRDSTGKHDGSNKPEDGGDGGETHDGGGDH